MEYKHIRPYMNELSNFETKLEISMEPYQRLGVAFLMQYRVKYGFTLLTDEIEISKVIPRIRIALIGRPSRVCHACLRLTNS